MLRTTILPSIVTRPDYPGLQALRGPRGDKAREEARLREVSKEFEALLVEMMVKSMRDNVPESPLFGKSTGEEIFQEMLDGEYARVMVERRGFGIAETLFQQLRDKF